MGPRGTVEIIYSSEALNGSVLRTTSLIGFIIIAMILLQVLFLYISVGRLVTKPLHEMTSLASRVAAGDYRGHVSLKSQDEMNILADTFNNMTTQLSQTLGSLEQRVKDRTTDLERSKLLTEKHAQDLETVADISRSIAAIQDLDQLLPVIARSISEHLGYYHIGIYLLNEAKDFLILKAANSEGGQRMLQRKDTSLPVEPSSLVGFVAFRKQPRVTQDVDRDAIYLADPDLPDTKSEVGLPLMVGTEIIGVLDVQSSQPNAFAGQEVNVLTTLANQIAISVRNAQLFGETRRALAESEKIYQQFIQQGWGRIIKESPVQGYKYSQQGLVPLETSREMLNIAPGSTGKDQSAILSIPIKLRDQAIGTVSIHTTDLLTRELDEDELTIIQAAVERAALALENARLLEDSQRRATRERAIGEISSKISEKSEIEAVLRSAAEELGKKLTDAEVTVEIDVL
jgi:GAF domain-containing protein/HAMP domain-containing protein